MERRIGTQEPNETKMSIPFTVPTFVHECLVKKRCREFEESFENDLYVQSRTNKVKAEP